MTYANNLKLTAQIAVCDNFGIPPKRNQKWVQNTQDLNLFPELENILFLKVAVASEEVHHLSGCLLFKIFDDVCHIGAPIARVLESVSYLEVSGHWSGIMEIAEGSFNPSRNIQSEKNRISV